MSEKPVDPHEVTTADTVAPAALAVGSTIGGYHLLRVLGEGGMGVVWLARDPLLDRTLAIKVLKRSDAAPSLRKRLLREARAMARLKHPNVLTVYEVGTEGERDFIAMELVDGGPLDDWLARDPPRGDVVAALLAAGRGLASAHAAGLVHRDFKPNNVLRSKAGRVLVTDFGLARGLADDGPAIAPIVDANTSAHDVTHDAHHACTDSVLHLPLTKTGALIGTPAYMAPEQFTGAPPDPRTDQFAFCVTAWQALTGARPFHGRTLEELRLAASSGVESVVCELPKGLRAVLTRGLDPEPANRWPDLDSLLDAFERAAKPARRYGPAIAGVVAISVIVAIVVATRGGSAPTEKPCEPASAVYADADGKLPAFAAHRSRWFAEYEQACKDGKPVRARVDCLQTLRDHTQLVAVLSKQRESDFDPYLVLPHPSACAGRTPVMTAPVPEDLRERVTGMLGTAFELQRSAIVVRRGPEVEETAKRIAWKPLLPTVQIASAHGYLRLADVGRARDAFTRALSTADSELRLVALARLGMLEASLVELAHPDEFPDTKPETVHEELARTIAYAKQAVKVAGDDPLLLAMLALLEARVQADLAERNPRKFPHDEALSRVRAARSGFEQAGDLDRATRAATLEAMIYLARGDDRGLDDAAFTTRAAAELLQKAKRPPSFELDALRARIAFARGDLKDAHAWIDQIPVMSRGPQGSKRSGVVLDATGKPASGATVVAWIGELHGDARRLYTTQGTLQAVTTVTLFVQGASVSETDRDGRFTISAADGAAIVAQHADARSTPQAIADTNTLRVQPTTELVGTVDTKPRRTAESASSSTVLADAFARFSVGKASWFLHAPIDKDRAFRMRGLPVGKPVYGVIGPSGSGTRRITAASATKLAWPAGHSVDVIVRGLPSGTLWLFRGGVQPTNRAELDLLIASATELVIAPLEPIGSRTTDAGRALYVAGDRHAIVRGETDHATACVASSAPDAPVTCKKLMNDEKAVLIEITASSGTR